MHDLRALDSQTLFAASDWMRRIAKALVHDDDRADDLVQEAWQAALRNPPRAALRPWLGGILRRKAKEAHRARTNLTAREERAAVPEGLPSTADLAACAEEQRYLIDCVLALPEKYREVVLLRFYEDLLPGEYTVGTKEWVEQLAPRSMRYGLGGSQALDVPWTLEVAAGETTRMTWNEAWVAGTSHQGTVTLEGERPLTTVVVQPIYFDLTNQLCSQTSWRALSRDGNFATDPTSPEPVGFHFAERKLSGFALNSSPQRPTLSRLGTLPASPDGHYALSAQGFGDTR